MGKISKPKKNEKPSIKRIGMMLVLVFLASCSGGQSGKFDAGGYSLFIHCVGGGSPTIIMDTGTPGDASNWIVLLPDLQQMTRVCVYDRAGMGASDLGPKPNTSQKIVDDLHALLTKANISGPYVLVGWSFGGMNMRLYAYQYPNDVVGVILLDSSHPDQFRRFLEALPPESASESAEAKELRSAWAANTLPGKFNFEGADWDTSSTQVRTANSLADIHLVVITAGLSNWSDFPANESTDLDNAWQSMQKELVTLSTNSKQIVATESYHCIQCSQPKLVIDAIRDVVKAAQSR